MSHHPDPDANTRRKEAMEEVVSTREVATTRAVMAGEMTENTAEMTETMATTREEEVATIVTEEVEEVTGKGEEDILLPRTQELCWVKVFLMMLTKTMLKNSSSPSLTGTLNMSTSLTTDQEDSPVTATSYLMMMRLLKMPRRKSTSSIWAKGTSIFIRMQVKRAMRKMSINDENKAFCKCKLYTIVV